MNHREIFLAQSLEDTEVVACVAGTAFVVTRASPDREGAHENEDGALVQDLGKGRTVLAVADGVGGTPAGADAAKAALERLSRTVQDGVTRRGQDLRAAILDGIERAQEDVRALGGGAATTLAVVGISENRARPFHVGDSEILLVGQRGKLKHRSLSHAPVAYAYDSGYLEERDAMTHDDRHLVSNALGFPDWRIEVGPKLKIAPRDTLLLATDGLMDNLMIDEVIERIRSGPADDNTRELLNLAAQRMSQDAPKVASKLDDLTFVLWRRTP